VLHNNCVPCTGQSIALQTHVRLNLEQYDTPVSLPLAPD
jgi:hypothetical protein